MAVFETLRDWLENRDILLLIYFIWIFNFLSHMLYKKNYSIIMDCLVDE